jgi:hypothetical protein
MGIVVSNDSDAVAIYNFTLDDTEVEKYNPNHGSNGQFASGGGGGGAGGAANGRVNPYTNEPDPNGINPFTGKTQAAEHEDEMRTSLDEATKLGADTNGTFKIMRAVDKKDSTGLRQMRRSIIRDRQRALNSGRPEARPMRKKDINMLAHLANGVNSGLASFEGKAPFKEIPQI